jgi:hypothetical protein
MNYGVCEVCEDEPAVGVASIPMMPVSVAYGRMCLGANAHPWWALVANTAMCGGLIETNEAWQRMVYATCAHLGRTIEAFNAAVAQLISEDSDIVHSEPDQCDRCPPTPHRQPELNMIGDEVLCRRHFNDLYQLSPFGGCYERRDG